MAKAQGGAGQVLAMLFTIEGVEARFTINSTAFTYEESTPKTTLFLTFTQAVAVPLVLWGIDTTTISPPGL
jgi:hypothetical protein